MGCPLVEGIAARVRETVLKASEILLKVLKSVSSQYGGINASTVTNMMSYVN
jgi:hypothetical protein